MFRFQEMDFDKAEHTLDDPVDVGEFVDYDYDEGTNESQKVSIADEFLELDTESTADTELQTQSIGSSQSPPPQADASEGNSLTEMIFVGESNSGMGIDSSSFSIKSDADEDADRKETEAAVNAIRGDSNETEAEHAPEDEAEHAPEGIGEESVGTIENELELMHANESADESAEAEAAREPSPKKTPTEAPAAPKPVEEVVERTVNLLNNNKIIIKSIKSTNSTNVSPITAKDDTSTRADRTEPNPVPQRAEDSNEFDPEKNADEVERKASTQHPKIKREIEQLRKTVNESKVLTEIIIDRNARGRRSQKLLSKHEQMSLQANEIEANKVASVEPSPSNSRNVSPENDGEKLVNASGKRNTRSRNSDFTAKQKRFMKGILEVTRGSDDESENSMGADDATDADFYVANGKQFEQSELREGEDEAHADANKVSISVASAQRADANRFPPAKVKDDYCWRCHQSDCQASCSRCIRSYHQSCIKLKQSVLQEIEKWVCPECIDLEMAEAESKK